MNIETEIKYLNTDNNKIRKDLIKLGFIRTQEERTYNCYYFHFEEDIKNKRNRWGRIKDDGCGNILMGMKEVLEDKIGGVGEVDLYINCIEAGKQIFYALGMVDKKFHKMTREIWKIEDENVEITLDNWDVIEPNIEIESDCVEKLKKYSKLLGLDFSKAIY